MRPINDEGQTVEGGHRWKLDAHGDVEEMAWETDSYPYCMGPECTECWHMPCRSCDSGWTKELCPETMLRPFLPLDIPR